MNSNPGDALPGKDRSSLGGIDGLVIPADADLGGDRDRPGSLDHGGCHAGKQGTIPQQRRAPVFAHDLVHRAPEVEIQKIRLNPINEHFRSLGETFGITAK